MLGAISHASPPRRPGSLPTRLPPASRRGAAQGVEGALSARLGRKLANEGQKGWGRRNYIFLTFLRQIAPGECPLRSCPPRWPPGSPHTHLPSLSQLRSQGWWPQRDAETGRAAMFLGSRAARPAPPPWRGRRRARVPECGRRASCGEPAPGRPSLVRAGRGAGMLGWPLGGPLGVSSWFRAEGVLFIIFLTVGPS